MPEERATSVRPTLVLQKVRRILESFTLDDPDLSLQEITRRTELPASTCQRLVQNLVGEGFLDKDGDVYRIGLGLVHWAAPGTYGMDLVRTARPVLDELRDAAGETAYLQVRDGSARVIVAVSEVRNVVIRRFTVGMVMPLHAGSGGKVFLAYDPEAWNAALSRGLSTTDINHPTDFDRLQGDLATVRQQGYAATFEERDAGAGSLSAPVFGMDGALAAVVGIGAPIQRFDGDTANEHARAVTEAARRASRAIGYR